MDLTAENFEQILNAITEAFFFNPYCPVFLITTSEDIFPSQLTLELFKRQLKTHLFKIALNDELRHLWRSAYSATQMNYYYYYYYHYYYSWPSAELKTWTRRHSISLATKFGSRVSLCSNNPGCASKIPGWQKGASSGNVVKAMHDYNNNNNNNE